MTALSNRELVGRACDQLHEGLLPLVEKAMRAQHPGASSNWVTVAHQAMCKPGSPAPKGPDLQFLLKCMTRHWQKHFQHLGNGARGNVSLLSDVRNGLAHYAGGASDLPADEARELVVPAVRLLQAAAVPQAERANVILAELRGREAHALIRPTTEASPAAEPSPRALEPIPAPTDEPQSPVTKPTPATQVLPAPVRLRKPTRPEATVELAAPRPLPYAGKVPSNVSKEAKYTCRLDGRITLQFDLGNGEETLLTSSDHPELVAMVQMVKEHFDEPPAGVFYINEHHHVLVKAAGGTWYAGTYAPLLIFEFEGRLIGPEPPTGARAGDPWHGPHVGINYTLTADGKDVYYKRTVRKGVEKKERLSAYADASVVARLARPIKQQGGRLYINEARALFTPVLTTSGLTYVYLGTIAAQDWFPAPETAA